MFGRVRAAPSSLDCLELERPPSKIIKDDSLSIYEITLNKLRLGAKRAMNSSSTAEPMKIDSPSSSSSTESTSPSSGGNQSSVIVCKEQLEDKNCSPPAPFKCKRWPWSHDHSVLTANSSGS